MDFGERLGGVDERTHRLPAVNDCREAAWSSLVSSMTINSLLSSEDLAERIGGTKTIASIVGALYFQITNDPRVAHFFEGAPMDRIIAHQRDFLMMALTGNAVYTGRSLAEAHADLIERHGLSEAHFDIVCAHLVTTMSELEIDAEVADEITRRVSATKPLIFGVKTPCSG